MLTDRRDDLKKEKEKKKKVLHDAPELQDGNLKEQKSKHTNAFLSF